MQFQRTRLKTWLGGLVVAGSLASSAFAQDGIDFLKSFLRLKLNFKT